MGQRCGTCEKPEPQEEQIRPRPLRQRRAGRYRGADGSEYRWVTGFTPVESEHAAASPECHGVEMNAVSGSALAAVMAWAAAAAAIAAVSTTSAVPTTGVEEDGARTPFGDTTSSADAGAVATEQPVIAPSPDAGCAGATPEVQSPEQVAQRQAETGDSPPPSAACTPPHSQRTVSLPLNSAAATPSWEEGRGGSSDNGSACSSSRSNSSSGTAGSSVARVSPRRQSPSRASDLLPEDGSVALGQGSRARLRAGQPSAAQSEIARAADQQSPRRNDEYFSVPPLRAAASRSLGVAAHRPQEAAPPVAQDRCCPSSPPLSPSPRGQPPLAASEYGPDGYLCVREGSTLTATTGRVMELHRYLGFGCFSTVWHATAKRGRGTIDLALKIARTGDENVREARKEADTLARVRDSAHLRCFADRVLTLLFSVEISGPHGVHVGVGVPLMGSDVHHLCMAHGTRGVDPVLAKVLVKQLLQGLAHLSAAGFAHTDIKPANLLLGPTCRPGAPPKGRMPSGDDLLAGRFYRPRRGSLERALLQQYPLKVGDMGGCVAMRLQVERQPIDQTVEYSPPEVLAGAPLVSRKVGTCAAACVAFELVTGETLFDPGQQPTELETDKAQWVAWYRCLGSPPEMYGDPERFAHARMFFTPDGTLRDRPRARGVELWRRLDPYRERLETRQGQLQELHTLMLRMLAYDPEERVTPLKALQSPWLKG